MVFLCAHRGYRWGDLPHYGIEGLVGILLTVEDIQLLQSRFGPDLEIKVRSATGEEAHTRTDKTSLIVYFQCAKLPLTGHFAWREGSMEIIFIPQARNISTGEKVSVDDIVVETQTHETNEWTLNEFIENVKIGKTEQVAQYLEENPSLLNGTQDIGMNPLLWAAWGGHVEIVKLLLDKGADVNLPDSGTKITPLHMAVNEGHVEIVRLLISRGSKINAQDLTGGTPLHHAAYKGRFEAAKLLLDKGAKTNFICTDIEAYGTAAQIATRRGHKEILKLIGKRRWRFW